MIEPYLYDVSPLQERLIWGGAREPGPSAAATAAVDNVSRLFANDEPKPAPNSAIAKHQDTKNNSGKGKL
ncbi:hypothetical protein N0V84_011140 [Fusarium piperis]|uniref:Uncharacterized protein n=1 Tax=Fusarium piperis TaxID=1435070 RepID=A0A9W8TCI1_9HYPO|nr:hypothetical protein N0V84_011140 [Fusarium piperis]